MTKPSTIGKPDQATFRPLLAGGRWIRSRARLGALATIFLMGLRHLKSLRKTMISMRRMNRRRHALLGEGPLTKMAVVDKRVFFDPSAPGYPSRALRGLIRQELHRDFPFLDNPGLRVVYFSITKKCSLRCKHCYEWAHLGRPERLGPDDLVRMVHSLQDFGTGVFYLEGGEPLQRFDDLLYLLEHARPSSDFWIITSGLGLTADKARRLKAKGLTGVMVSLDHWQAERHNAFRGHDHIFDWALRAVANGNRAGLVTALSLCVTRDMSTREHIKRYMSLARRMGVSFVQWLEPRAVGRWAHADNALLPEHHQVLENAFLDYNLNPELADFPIVIYPALLQRRKGCTGAGQQFLYVDSNGAVNACPFCQHPVGRLLEEPVSDLIAKLQDSGCHAFPLASTAPPTGASGLIETEPKPTT